MSDQLESLLSKKNKVVFGVLVMLFSVALLVAFISYLFTWHQDESIISEFMNREVAAQNSLSKLGATLSHFFIYKGFGLASFMFVYLFFLIGIYFFVGGSHTILVNRWLWGVFSMLWMSVIFSLFSSKNSIISGVIGFETYSFFIDYIGEVGLALLLIFAFSVYLFLRIGITPDRVVLFFQNIFRKADQSYEEEYYEDDKESPIDFHLSTESNEERPTEDKNYGDLEVEIGQEDEEDEEDEIEIEINKVVDEKNEKSNLSDKLVEDYGKFDPTLELSDYKFPPLDKLQNHGDGGININQEELEGNKEKIVKTLLDYKIEISHIKATVGPTVTLYEIIPSAGVRISKIKNLEDDIALSLSALGIRIIAPMPGKGTIGIEVPNKKPSMVSMRTVIASRKFQHSDMALPIALGKTISNETFIVDLAKMPHLLMAGATGQGKSVGLNAILASLLYKKHPAEVKFVLVDPKKVELTLFNKIERHFLAKLPNSEEAIITDNSKVINTLNSLCMEMDDRYDLLKDAAVRNISEYNEKFKNRKLNPENEHRFLPYLVLIVDEFADLIMTAGKEVETPIARLAQLARAIGIHLIIATQRPSVNVITGLIKANFPARIAFRVTSKIDSRTILDSQGAEQLIGRGDMLFTQGNDLTRLQCAFVDTPEVENVTEFIGSQRGYPDAYILPEYIGEELSLSDVNSEDRDLLFREAAEILVMAQQGSTSLIQRKLKLGYNRAGRIIDQLEAAGIVGPFEGSKARQVLVQNLESLEKLLNSSEENH